MRSVVCGKALMALAGLAAIAGPAAAEQVVVLDSRPGATQPVILVEPAGRPVASVVLLAGGDGFVRNRRNPDRLNNNFLVRSRDLFARRGLLVAVLDLPSDRQDSGLLHWRDSREHAADIAAAAKWLRARAGVPVWLVGTSRGTISAVHAAVPAAADGLVLTSSVTRPARRDPGNVMDAALDRIRVPVLIALHRGDECTVTPPEDAAAIKRALRASPRVEILAFDGGDPPRSNPCQAMSQHGFLGIEDKVVGAIADWIMAQGRR